MAKPNLSKFSAAERLALAKELATFQDRDDKLTTLINAFKKDLDSANFTVEEAVALLAPRKSRGPNKPTSKASAPTASKSVDSTGAKPKPGTTYALPTGETWTKNPNGLGATNKLFSEAIAAGKTWAELEKGSAPVRKPAAKKAAAKRNKAGQ
jgi:hypothetical protein